MASPIITSIITMLIGVALLVGGKQFSGLFELASGKVDMPTQYVGQMGLFEIAGLFLIVIGFIFLLFTVLFTILRKRQKKKAEEQQPQEKEVFVCPFCNAKFDYEDDLNTHVQQAHDEEAQTMEQAGINWRGEQNE